MEQAILEFLLAMYAQDPEHRTPRHVVRDHLQIAENNRAQRAVFEEAVAALVATGQIERVRGRGGGLRYLPPAPANEAAIAVEVEAEVRQRNAERAFYEPICNAFPRWREQLGDPERVLAFVTGMQGQGAARGTWSRPDLIVCAIGQYLFMPVKTAEVVSIEVKRWDALNVQGVYEAAHHRRQVHSAYLMIVNAPREMTAADEGRMFEIAAVAAEQGVGVIVAPAVRVLEAMNADEWTVWLEPARTNTPNHTVHAFLNDRLNGAQKAQIQDALMPPAEGQPSPCVST